MGLTGDGERTAADAHAAVAGFRSVSITAHGAIHSTRNAGMKTYRTHTIHLLEDYLQLTWTRKWLETGTGTRPHSNRQCDLLSNLHDIASNCTVDAIETHVRQMGVLWDSLKKNECQADMVQPLQVCLVRDLWDRLRTLKQIPSFRVVARLSWIATERSILWL